MRHLGPRLEPIRGEPGTPPGFFFTRYVLKGVALVNVRRRTNPADRNAGFEGPRALKWLFTWVMPHRICVGWGPDPLQPGYRGCVSEDNPARQESITLLRDAWMTGAHCVLEHHLVPDPDASRPDEITSVPCTCEYRKSISVIATVSAGRDTANRDRFTAWGISPTRRTARGHPGPNLQRHGRGVGNVLSAICVS